MENMNFLIDNRTMDILKVTPTVEQATYWAEILVPTHDFKVVGFSKSYLKGYTSWALTKAVKRIKGLKVAAHPSIDQMIDALHDHMSTMTVDETSLDDLIKRFGSELPTPESLLKTASVKKFPKATRKVVKAVEAGEPVPFKSKRPREGSMTVKVWNVADSFAEKCGGIPDRAEVIEHCMTLGVKQATASKQFWAWADEYKRNPANKKPVV